MKLILASGSLRRAEILRNAGFDFQVVPSHTDETRWPEESPVDYVRRLAEAKARAAATAMSAIAGEDASVVIGADTVVVAGADVLGKPASPAEAREMLRRLSGKTHEVLTGLAILPLAIGVIRVVVESTRVTFEPMKEREIENYIATGEPFDKAGAYAIQGRGGKFISRIEGCYFNVMGLPLARLYSILRELDSH